MFQQTFVECDDALVFRSLSRGRKDKQPRAELMEPNCLDSKLPSAPRSSMTLSSTFLGCVAVLSALKQDIRGAAPHGVVRFKLRTVCLSVCLSVYLLEQFPPQSTYPVFATIIIIMKY